MTPAQSSLNQESISISIVEAIADKEGISPLELDPPLVESIDTEALDSLFRTNTSECEVEFTYLDYRVTVSGAGQVSVEPIYNSDL